MKVFVLIYFYIIYSICLTTTVTQAAATKKANARIIGGDLAFAGQFPYIAAIYKTTSNGNYFCGGALLNDQWILTSGSCVDGAILFTIHLGSNNLKATNANTLTLATDSYVLHPDYNPNTLEHDVGLIQLRLAIKFNTYLRPIDNLPSSELFPGTSGVVAMGWGQTSDESSGLVDDLNFVYLSPLDNEECKLTYGDQITESMICASGNYNEGFCHGDNGTPLVRIRSGHTATHEGIASFVSQHGCESSDPSGYTKTLDYVDWIRNVTDIK